METTNIKFEMTEQYRAFFDQTCMKLMYDMMRTKVFIPIGLELSATNIFFDDNKTFKLKDFTFAFYNPVENSIHINIEDEFFTKCTGIKSNAERAARLFFVLFHETMHKILMHTPERLNDRNPELWNIAADYEVHNMYYLYSKTNNNDEQYSLIMADYLAMADNVLFNNNENQFLFDKNYLDKIAEEIYTMIENSKEEESHTYKFDLDDFMKSDSQGNTSSSNNNSEQGSNESGNEGENESDDENNNGSNSEKNKDKKSSGSGSDSSDSDNTVEEENLSNGSAGKKSTGNDKVKGLSDNNMEVSVTQTTYTLPNGQKYTATNINWPDEKQLPDKYQKSDKEKEQAKQNKVCNRSLIENNFEQMVKNKGNMPKECEAFLKKLFHIKVDWEKILRNSLQTILEKSDYFAWNKVRTSSFLLPNMSYLPDIIEDEEKYGTLIIARDESGSMSDEELSKAAGIIMDAKEFYKKIVVIKHDTDISKVYEFEDINDDVVKTLMKRERYGGTSHKEVFKYLETYQKEHYDERISCFISITDMESDIQEYQNLIPSNVPVIYLAPYNSEKNWQDISGKIIPIEL